MKDFKVGDLVTLKNEYEGFYVITNEESVCKIISVNKHDDKSVMLVELVSTTDKTNKAFVGHSYYVSKDKFKLVKPTSMKIVIYRKGNEVFAKDSCGRTATAKCAPEDEFNFNIGASMALTRLISEEEHATADKNVKEANINVGQTIRIIDPLRSYTLYTNWIDENKDRVGDFRYMFDYGKQPKKDIKCKIVAKASHLVKNIMLYYVKDINEDRTYIMSSDGFVLDK